VSGGARPSVAVAAVGLCKTYGKGPTEVVAVRDATFELGRGEVVALLGPSGSGKSTRIVIGGTPVFEHHRSQVDARRYRRQHLGFVFQKANLIPFLTAGENVRLAMEIDGVSGREARARALLLLDYLGVAERADHLPSKLSGGEQQRVAVARALANRPSLVLADEPTAALDSVRGRQVMELLRKVAHEQDAAVLVVTHDHRALDVFDRALEMEDGVVRLRPPAVDDRAARP
jgi:putative ABC transport system ATP-binding protein